MTETYSKKVRLKNVNFNAEIVLDFHNVRLKIEEYRGCVSSLISTILQLSEDNNLTKIIVKTKFNDQFEFLSQGFGLEAVIPRYYNGEHVFMYTKYLTESRKTTNSWIQEDLMLADLSSKKKLREPTHSMNFPIRKATENDAYALSQLYTQIFKVYPTPLSDPTYIKKTMKSGTIYSIVEHENKIISTASAELNSELHNAEITDCATLPDFRKHKLMKHLILFLEGELINMGVFCAYSIARSASYGMNAVLHQLDYTYNGRLTNNCYIYENIENMNVWGKDLSRTAK